MTQYGRCWTWTGSLARGYGQASVGGRRGYVHRLVYEELVGPIPAGLDLDHLCRNRACYNPAHLEPVTRSENLRRSPDVARNGRAQLQQHRHKRWNKENT